MTVTTDKKADPADEKTEPADESTLAGDTDAAEIRERTDADEQTRLPTPTSGRADLGPGGAACSWLRSPSSSLPHLPSREFWGGCCGRSAR